MCISSTSRHTLLDPSIGATWVRLSADSEGCGQFDALIYVELFDEKIVSYCSAERLAMTDMRLETIVEHHYTCAGRIYDVLKVFTW